jgi:lipopolysaccharide export system protein LptC
MVHFLETPKMRHIPKNDKHILKNPHLIISEPKQAPWEIHANHGTATSKAQTITLSHHVHIVQHKPNEETEIKTEHLTYYPQEKKAKTNDEVSITQSGSQVQSKGMIADLTDNHIQLLSNARGHYVKPKE